MNLHSIKFRLTNVAIWLMAYGANGREIGSHLWVIEEGTPPTEPQTRPSWTSASYWTPTRLHWRPFQYGDLFREGFVQPLCGQRSASRRPRISVGWDACSDCRNIAVARGIVPLTYEQAQAQSSTYDALQAELAAWREAGRPSPWPPSPSDNPTS